MQSETIDFSAAQQAIEYLLDCISDDPKHLTDVHIQGGQVTVRTRGGVLMRDHDIRLDPDRTVAEIAALTASALRREIGARSPILEQRIPPRYRVTCSHPSICQDGHWHMALRLLAQEVIPLPQWVADGFLSVVDYDRLFNLMAAPTTVLIAGTMGAGKTQLLRSLLAAMPTAQRLLVLEDAAELNVERPNTVSLQTSHAAGLAELIAHAFRGDADRVVVGEIREYPTAMEFLTLASGGTRALTTIHTQAGAGALVRLHNLVLRGGYQVKREEIEEAIDAIVTVERLPDGGRQVRIL